MSWNRDLHERNGEDILNLSYPPSGGRLKMVFLGLLLPAWIAFHAWKAWTSREAIWFGDGTEMDVTGDTARAMAVCYLATALLAHFRWFWGLWPSFRVFEIRTILSIILGLGGCGSAFYFVVR